MAVRTMIHRPSSSSASINLFYRILKVGRENLVLFADRFLVYKSVLFQIPFLMTTTVILLRLMSPHTFHWNTNIDFSLTFYILNYAKIELPATRANKGVVLFMKKTTLKRKGIKIS